MNTIRQKKRKRPAKITKFAPIVGTWTTQGSKAAFVKYEDKMSKFGIALTQVRAKAGHFRATVAFSNVRDCCADFVIGYSPQDQAAFTVGIGAYGRAYAITKYVGGRSRPVFGLGSRESLNLAPDQKYKLELRLKGQAVNLSVDGIQVLAHTLPHPLPGDQFGIKAFGEPVITFTDVEADTASPLAFVVMQYSEPYNSLWEEVIRPVAGEEGYYPIRADDIFRPGVVLHDILRGIIEADVVIAEVTPSNQNVFYELGYAHALGKPTVLLAEKDAMSSLPFDISSYRCIFYRDAIAGKSKVAESLRRYLRNIREENQDGVSIELSNGESMSAESWG